MIFSELSQKLTPQDGLLDINTDTLTTAFGDFLQTHYLAQGRTIPFRSATIEIDEASQKITLVGKSSFLSVPDVPATAIFSLDETGEVVAQIRYDFITREQSPNYWNFGMSFPYLPYEVNGSGGYGQPIADLRFWEASFIVNTLPVAEDARGIALETGINFVGKALLPGIAGILANLFDANVELLVSGTVRLPQNDLALYNPDLAYDVTSVRMQAWEFPLMHGIQLKIHLGKDFNIGNLQCSDSYFRLYSPLKRSWNNFHYQYCVQSGFTTHLQSGNFSLDFVGQLEDGATGIFVEANLDGFSLKNLLALDDFMGEDMSKTLQPIMAIADAAARLELLTLAFSISFGESGFGINNFTAQVGFDDIDWVIWQKETKSGEKDPSKEIAITGIGVAISVYDIMTAPHLDVNLWGTSNILGVGLDMRMSIIGNSTLTLAMNNGVTLPLGDMVRFFDEDTNFDMPDLHIDSLMLDIDFGDYISFSGSLANEPNAWTFEIGKQELTFKDISFYMNYRLPDKEKGIAGAFAGNFHGTVALNDDFVLETDYQYPGELVLRASFEKINFTEFVDLFVEGNMDVPQGVTFELYDTYILMRVSKQNNSATIQAATRWKDVGNFALEIGKNGGTWGAAGGFALSNVPKLSGIEGFGFLQPLEEIVDLQDFMVVASTFTSPSFQFPALSQFNNPALTAAKVPMPAQAGGLVQGFNVFARWQLDTDKGNSKVIKVLRQILGLDPSLAVTLQIGKNPAEFTRLFFKYDSKIVGKYPMQAQLGFALTNKRFEMFLAGFAEVPIQGEVCRFDVAMSLVTSGVYFSGSMKGTLKFGNLQLSNLALALGFNWGGIPTLGVAANIDLPNFHSSVAMLFDSTDPSRSILAGALSDFTLYDIASGIAGANDISAKTGDVLKKIAVKGSRPFTIPISLVDALDSQDLAAVSQAFYQYGKISLPASETSTLFVCNKKGELWSITDMTNNMRHYEIKRTEQKDETGTERTLTVSLNAQLYISPKGAMMGAITYPQGYFMTGTLAILGVEWSTYIDIRQSKGIAIESSMNKEVVIYKPQFFRLGASAFNKRADATPAGVVAPTTNTSEPKQGAMLSIATFAQPEHTVPEFRLPHVFLSGSLTLLGLTYDAYVELSTNGFAVSISQMLKNGFNAGWISGSAELGYNIQVAFNGLTNFKAGGGITMGIKGEIDVVKALEGIFGDAGNYPSGAGKISVDMGVSAQVEAGYDGKQAYVRLWGDVRFKGAKRNFDLQLDASNAQITKAYEYALKELREIVKDLFDTAEEWANAVKEGFITAVETAEQMAQVLKNAYKKSAEDALRLINAAGKSLEDGMKALKKVFNSTTEDIAKFARNIGADFDKIGGALDKAFGIGAKEVGKIFTKVFNTSPEDLAKMFKSVFKLDAEKALQILKDLGLDWSKVANAIKNAFGSSAKEIANFMNKLGASVEDLGKILSQSFGKTAEEISGMLKDLGKTADEIGRALKNALGQGAKQAAELLQKLGFDTDAIGKMLQGIFGSSSLDTAKVLQAIGKNAREIGKVLKNFYSMGAEDVSRTLETVGRSLQNIANTLKDVFGLDAKGASQVLKNIGKTAQQIGESVKAIFNTSVEDFTKILNDLAFSANDIANIAKNIYGKTVAEAAQLLDKLGKTVNEIGNALKQIFANEDNAVIAWILKGLGKSLDEVGRFLKDALKFSNEYVIELLGSIGYAVKDVASFAKKVLAAASEELARALNKIGKSVEEIGKTLKDIYGKSAEDAARILNGIGKSAEEIGDVLKGTYGKSYKDACKILKSIGKSATDVAKTMKNVYDLSAKEAGNVVKDTYDLGKDAAKSVMKAAGYASNEVEDWASDTWKDVKDWFGKVF